MADRSFQVKGLAELDRVLGELPRRVANNSLRAAVRAGLKPVLEAARANIHSISGDLARSLRIVSRRQRSPNQVAGAVSTSKLGYYGRWVELGTVHAPPHPFMRTALDSQAENAVNTMAAKLRERLAEDVRPGWTGG